MGLKAFREVFIFIFLIVVFHFLWRLWANVYEYRLFGKEFMGPVFNFLTHTLREVCAWISIHFLHIETTVSGNLLQHDPMTRLAVTVGCSGLKQYYQFFFLMALYPGPWRKKTWFIPLGLLAIFITNIIRIVFLYVVVIYNVELFHVTHDWILRPLFFAVMFVFWVWWIERLAIQDSVKA